ncbi:MAG: tetratricopeptide repeat protein [Nitrosomonadales bacterium]|nr:tetratricopeptide repeat protein [Nitrosomonadales bacterium]
MKKIRNFNRLYFAKILSLILLSFCFKVSFGNQQNNFNPNLPPKITEANAEFVYKFLLAEIAAQRGDFNSAGHIYLDLAKQTHSISLAERATRIAGSSRNGRVALDSAKVWNSLDPKSIQAQQILAELYITSGNLSKAKPIVKKLLEQDTYRGGGFLYLNSILAKVVNKKNALRFIIDIAEPYSNSKEARFAVAHAAYFANNKKLANSELVKIKKIDPKWQTAALFEGYIIGLKSQRKAENFYISYLKKYPEANEVRLEYAKLLTNQKKYNLAKDEFLKIVNSSLASAEISFTVSLLAIELGDHSLAENFLMQSLERGYPEPEQIYIYLARIEDTKGNYSEALTWLNKINSGPFFIESKILAAELIAKYEDNEQAIESLDQYNNLTPRAKLQLFRAKLSILYSDNKDNEAYELIKKEGKNFQDSPEFKYDYAMLAEKMGNAVLMEQLLREAIKIKPDYAVAYNALGYSFADRNIKLDEAKINIEIALSLEPENHYIIDSMGWVQYRLGNIDAALDFLRKAYAIKKDPEISAHLGEVLWEANKIDEAKQIWKESLQQYPDNKILLRTVKKYR